MSDGCVIPKISIIQIPICSVAKFFRNFVAIHSAILQVVVLEFGTTKRRFCVKCACGDNSYELSQKIDSMEV